MGKISAKFPICWFLIIVVSTIMIYNKLNMNDQIWLCYADKAAVLELILSVINVSCWFTSHQFVLRCMGYSQEILLRTMLKTTEKCVQIKADWFSESPWIKDLQMKFCLFSRQRETGKTGLCVRNCIKCQLLKLVGTFFFGVVDFIHYPVSCFLSSSPFCWVWLHVEPCVPLQTEDWILPVFPPCHIT